MSQSLQHRRLARIASTLLPAALALACGEGASPGSPRALETPTITDPSAAPDGDTPTGQDPELGGELPSGGAAPGDEVVPGDVAPAEEDPDATLEPTEPVSGLAAALQPPPIELEVPIDTGLSLTFDAPPTLGTGSIFAAFGNGAGWNPAP